MKFWSVFEDLDLNFVMKDINWSKYKKLQVKIAPKLQNNSRNENPTKSPNTYLLSHRLQNTFDGFGVEDRHCDWCKTMCWLFDVLLCGRFRRIAFKIGEQVGMVDELAFGCSTAIGSNTPSGFTRLKIGN
jgi:hypothetical protein